MDIQQWDPQIGAAVSWHGKNLPVEARDDLRQECYLAILQAEEAIARVSEQGPDNVKNYVYRIVNNACVDMLRERNKVDRIVHPQSRDKSSDFHMTEDTLGISGPETLIEGVDEKACQELYRIADFGVSNADLEAALSSLEEGEQYVVRASFFAGDSERDIGTAMGKSQAWVRKRKDRGLVNLREKLSWKKGS